MSVPSFSVLGHHVAGIVHHVGVVARTANHRVATRSTVYRVVAATAGQRVIASVTGQHVVQCIAGAGYVCRALQDQVLDIVRQHIAHRAVHRVGPCVRVLDHHVAGIVHIVSVVARAARHGVGARTAIQHVGCRYCQ